MEIEEDREFIERKGLSTWVIDFSASYEEDAAGANRAPTTSEKANAYGSANSIGKTAEFSNHSVLLDIDRHDVRVIPSSTPGHSHLVIPGDFRWHDILRLLEVLTDMGIIEEGFANISKERGQTFLRLPGVTKEN